MKNLILLFKIFIVASISTNIYAQKTTTCMDFDLYAETRDSRRINELALRTDALSTINNTRTTQCMAEDTLQCVDYHMKADAALFNSSQDAANELVSLMEQRKINEYCSLKLAKAKEFESSNSIPEDEKLNEQLFPYICTVATMIEDISRLFDNRDGKERDKVEIENQIANLTASIKKKEETIKIHEEKINEISQKIGTPSKVESDGSISKEGSGLLGDLGKGQSELILAQKALDDCKKQNTDAAQAHSESGSEEEFVPPCNVQEKEEKLVQAKVDLRLVAISLIDAMIELTGEETSTVISMLKGTLFGQLQVDGNKQNVAFQVRGENFELVDIGQAVSSNFGVGLDQAAAFDPDQAKKDNSGNATLVFLADMVANLGKEVPGNPYYNIDDVRHNYGVGCTKESVANGGCKQESRSNYFVDPDYGFDYSDYFKENSKEILTGMIDLTGNEISDTSNLGAIAYAATLQATQGRKEKIGTEENPEQGTVWASIKKDQDEISRFETGDKSAEKLDQLIAESNAMLKDRICVLNAMLSAYKKTFEGLNIKQFPPEKLSDVTETQRYIKEEIVGSTKYLKTYVYNWSISNFEKYSSSGFLGNYKGPQPREIAAEFVCVLKTDDVLACRRKYSAISESIAGVDKTCSYSGVTAGPAPPIGYGTACTKSEVGKEKQFDIYTFTCSCNY